MRLFVLCLLILSFPAAASPIYKCVNAAGKTQFTDKPCTGGATGELTNPPKPISYEPEDFGEPLTQSQAASACENAARARATNPSTVDFSRFWSAAFQAFPSGRATYISQFKAKNAFGLELNFDIACYFKGEKLDKVSVNEAR